MQGAEILTLILAVAFVVPIAIMWRTRMLRLEARIEVPPEEVPHTGPLMSAPPAAWTVSDGGVEHAPLQPIRAGSLLPIRSPSQRPVTISDGSPKPMVSLRPREPLPMPLRGSAIGFSTRPMAQATARANGLPVPLRAGHDEASEDEG